MAGTPRVQLSLKGRLLSEVAFVGPQLRIGRMRENDVVVNNLAVSRFHATLRREGDGYVLEDLGSENGTQLNGERIAGTVPMKPSDVIQLGKYELRLVLQPGLQIAGAPKAKPSDAWDASQTFLAMPPAAAKPAVVARPLPQAAAASPPALAPSPIARASAPPAAEPELGIFEEPELLSDVAGETPAPDPEGVFAFGEEDLGAAEDTGAPADESDDLVAAALATPNPEHTSLFDFGAPAAPEAAAEAEPAPAAFVEAPAPPEAAAPAGRLHAGLIVQRDGKLHLLRPWESGELCVGRAPECEIVLADAGVSRRHALFSFGHEGHTVRDLDSVNGIYVNGQRTKQHLLAVGDVVRIESFELTFVLDHQPIGSEVNGPKPIAPREQEHARATQFSLEAPAQESEDALELTSLAGDPNEAPGGLDAERSIGAPLEDITDGFEILAPADDPYAGEAQTADTSSSDDDVVVDAAGRARDAVREAMLPESDLVSADGFEDDEEKDPNGQSVLLTQLAEPVPSIAAPAPALAPARLQLRMLVDTAQLSPRAREALAVLAEEGVALAAQLRVEPSAE